MRTILGIVVFLVLSIGAAASVSAQETPIICSAAALDVTASGEWAEGAPMPTPRSELGAAAWDGVIYVAGGLTSDSVSDAFESYNVADDEWTELAPMPVGLNHLGIAALDGNIYVTGGYPDLNFTADARVWVYDLETDTWTQLNDLPDAIGAHQLVNVDNTLYIVGGVPQGTTLWKYDPESDSWDTSLMPMPTAREHLGATALDGRLVVVGGRWADLGNLAVVEAYDPATNEWETLPDMPTARGGFNIVALDGNIYAGGGEAFSGDSGCTFNRAEVFDPEMQTWELLPDMPTPRHGLSMASVDGQWFIIGGATGAGGMTYETTSDRVEIFTPAIE